MDYFDFADYASEIVNEEHEEFKCSSYEYTLGLIESLKEYDKDKFLHCMEELAYINNIKFNASTEALLLI